jgi:hypothetical protein
MFESFVDREKNFLLRQALEKFHYSNNDYDSSRGAS